jgi:hypothetical protein
MKNRQLIHYKFFIYAHPSEPSPLTFRLRR